MTTNLLTPNQAEIDQCLLDTVRHVMHIEYYLDRLGIGTEDTERPHDITGPGSKFEWEFIRGSALQYRHPKPDFTSQILPAIEFHRQQFHHRMWNNPNPRNAQLPVDGATEDNMLVGAVDAVCSLLESRAYQGGSHSFESIAEIARANPPHKAPWMLRVIDAMQPVPRPNLSAITNLTYFPNLGVPSAIYDAMRVQSQEALRKYSRR